MKITILLITISDVMVSVPEKAAINEVRMGCR